MGNKPSDLSNLPDLPDAPTPPARRGASQRALTHQSRVWELHLRGWSFSAIGTELCLDRKTVAGVVRKTYHELGLDRRDALDDALDESIARLRRIQMQAWADHDTDDERERAVLAVKPEAGQAPPRFTSQRASYLRVALDCEREIARLRGVYSIAVTPAQEERAPIVFHIERVNVRPAPDPIASFATPTMTETVEAGEAEE